MIDEFLHTPKTRFSDGNILCIIFTEETQHTISNEVSYSSCVPQNKLVCNCKNVNVDVCTSHAIHNTKIFQSSTLCCQHKMSNLLCIKTFKIYLSKTQAHKKHTQWHLWRCAFKCFKLWICIYSYATYAIVDYNNLIVFVGLYSSFTGTLFGEENI